MPSHGGFRRETRFSEGWHQDATLQSTKDGTRDAPFQLSKDGTGSVQQRRKDGMGCSQAVMLQAGGISMLSNLEPSLVWDLDLPWHDRDPRKAGTL